MAYLNLDPNYFEHPKTRRLVGLIGDKAEIYPIRLWCYCSKYHPEDGRFINYSAEEIEAILHWNGEKNLLVNSMTKVGFLNKKGNNYEVNDWKEHEGHIINYKKRSKIAAKARWDKIKKKNDAPSNAKDKSKHPILNHTLTSNQALPNHPYLQDKKFAKSFEEYLEMRKKIRKSPTKKAIELVFNKLNEYPIEAAIKMLEQSILNSWQGIFPLKTEQIFKERSNFSTLTDEVIEKALGKIATKDMIKNFLKDLPQPVWGKVASFLRKRYPENGDKAYMEAEREILREIRQINEQLKPLTEKIGNVKEG